ncbi:MAG: trypsin-like peptidase domain-containing protein [Gammaproteobacteria bacterium]|nr:trypsin-like peptidase domain-containing protein [Gammaproteobacteria bacterium]
MIVTTQSESIATRITDPDQVLAVHTRFQAFPRAIWLAVGAGIVLALLAGCMTQAARMQLEKTIVARKAESLRGWETVSLDSAPILKTLGLRTAIVFRNFESVTAWIDDSGVAGEGIPRANASTSAAAPISEDGYFLTAAHSVENAETLNLSVAVRLVDGQIRIETVPARIVWKSEGDVAEDRNRGEPRFLQDFAIVHANVGRITPFRLAEELPQTDEPVISAGWPFEHFGCFPDGAILAAGNILAVTRLDSRGPSPAGVAVLIDTPLVSGDSGGPALDRKGNLIGIHSQVGIRMSHLQGVAMLFGQAPDNFGDFEYSAVAYMPDPDWISETIENDRRQRITGSESSSP